MANKKKYKKDKVVKSILELVKDRYEMGLDEYGLPFSDAEYTTLECLEEAVEEAIDQVFYLQKAINDLRKRQKDE